MISIYDSIKEMNSKENIKVIKKKIELLQKYQYKATSKELKDKIFKKKSQLLMNLARFYFAKAKYMKAEYFYFEFITQILNQGKTKDFLSLYK